MLYNVEVVIRCWFDVDRLHYRPAVIFEAPQKSAREDCIAVPWTLIAAPCLAAISRRIATQLVLAVEVA